MDRSPSLSLYISFMHTRTHERAHARTNGRKLAGTHASTHARTHARTHTHTHTHTHTQGSKGCCLAGQQAPCPCSAGHNMHKHAHNLISLRIRCWGPRTDGVRLQELDLGFLVPRIISERLCPSGKHEGKPTSFEECAPGLSAFGRMCREIARNRKISLLIMYMGYVRKE